MHVPKFDRDSIDLRSTRASGILLHPTSLPGPHGVGDLGEAARHFVDTLAAAGQSFWQMLPTGPVGYGNSPYSAQSAFAGSPLLVALEPLVDAGFINRGALESEPPLPAERADYVAASRRRTHFLQRAFDSARDAPAFARFREEQASWLDDYALFRALKSAHGEVEWTRWPAKLRDRDSSALASARRDLSDVIAYRAFEQWLFDGQWKALRAYAKARGVSLIGDLPIFVAHDSADVWQHRHLFRLDPEGLPEVVAGVPPDYFSTTGQRWGNPLYRWKRLAGTGYAWWVARFRAALSRFDLVRLDHFIGFQRYWEIPGSEATAVNGRWMKGPGAELFRAVSEALGPLPLIAEDLGAVTPKVKALRDRFHLPGIKILQFAFGTDPSAPDFLPHNYGRRAVVYTGTHDNDTAIGWFHEHGGGESTRSPEQTALERRAALTYFGLGDAGGGGEGEARIHWEMIRTCMASVADTAIFPLQDVLGLGSEARMNRPGLATGNWEWRFTGELPEGAVQRLQDLSRTYGRNDAQTRAPKHEGM